MKKFVRALIIAGILTLGLTAGLACGSSNEDQLEIGYLADFSGPLAEFGPEIQKGVELAVEHINAAGGVNGQDVTLKIGDTALQEVQAINEARRLIDIEGVSAIVGPLASSITLSVVEGVAADASIPIVSPSATAPTISEARDRDFLFRTTLSDTAQGAALADLIEEDGIDNVAVLYINNPYGQGLIENFRDSFEGTVSAESHEAEQISYLAELEKVAAGGADYLIAMGYVGQAQVYLREAIEQGLFAKFYFVDGTRSEDLITNIGAEHLEGSKGTVSSSNELSDSFRIFDEAFIAKHGAPPARPYVREAYDATVTIALASQMAGSTNGEAIRQALRRVASPNGEVITAGPDSIRRGLSILMEDKNINYEGAATTVDWDDNGDVTSGFISIWTYQDGEIVDTEKKPVDLR